MNMRRLSTGMLIMAASFNVSAETVVRGQIPKGFTPSQKSSQSSAASSRSTGKDSIAGLLASFPPQDYIQGVFSSLLSRGPEKPLNQELQKRRESLLAPASSFVGILGTTLAAIAYGDKETHMQATEAAARKAATEARCKLAQAGINPNRWPELLEHVANHIAQHNPDLLAQLAAFDPSARAQAEQKLTALVFGWVKCALKKGKMQRKECLGVGQVWENFGKTYAFWVNGGSFDPLAQIEPAQPKRAQLGDTQVPQSAA